MPKFNIGVSSLEPGVNFSVNAQVDATNVYEAIDTAVPILKKAIEDTVKAATPTTPTALPTTPPVN